MKILAVILVMLGTATGAFAQGSVIFRNSSSTLLSAGGVPMPTDQQFLFAIFLAPSTTVTTTGITPAYDDPVWQNLGRYNTNAAAPGRIYSQNLADVGTPTGFFYGSTVDFVIRGWSANAGVTWSAALANWNNGLPLIPMFIGSSTIGDNIILGGDMPIPTDVFGLVGAARVQPFNMTWIPEPSSFLLIGFGVVMLGLSSQRNSRRV